MGRGAVGYLPPLITFVDTHYTYTQVVVPNVGTQIARSAGGAVRKSSNRHNYGFCIMGVFLAN